MSLGKIENVAEVENIASVENRARSGLRILSLIGLKQHMMQVKLATLGSLCNLFQCQPDMLRCMLQHWITKGKLRQCTKKPACGNKCFKCPTTDIEMYEWLVQV